MPEQRSEKSCFASRFGGGWLAAGQYLAESMVDRMARKEGETLPLKFWELPRWKRVFLLQLRSANELLKSYSVEAIIRALRTTEGKKVYSLGAPWLDGLIAGEQARLERQAEALKSQPPEAPLPSGLPEAPRPAFVRPSILNRLRDL